MDRNLVTISKFLAKHLRHAPDALGLTLQPGGWVSVDDLLAASERVGFPITYDELIASMVPVRGIIVTCKSADPRFDFVSRFFAPASGVDEDPVTGSAHCCLADFWRKRLGKSNFVAFQASSRGGMVNVQFVKDRAMLGGRAVTVARGELLVEEDEV